MGAGFEIAFRHIEINIMPIELTFLYVQVKHHLLTTLSFDAGVFFLLWHGLSVFRIAAIFTPDNAERKAIFLDFFTFLALLTILAWEWL